MKLVLYRGRSVADDKWYEGYFVNVEDYLSGEEQPVIIPIGTALYSHGEVSCLEFIDPVTVGQFVGAYDNNGKKIFEGDIVEKVTDTSFRLIVRDIRSFDRLVSFPSRYRVIGNIWDNPEMV